MSGRRVSLALLRARARALTNATALRSLARELEGDDRRGAAQLAAHCRGRAERLAREARRMRELFALRAELQASGRRWVAGVDEVGVGPLAGPVVAAAVILADEVDLPGLDDSKRLRPEERERLDEAIRAQAVAVAVAEVGSEVIDRVNVYQASLRAMGQAVKALEPAPDHVLVDARRIPALDLPQTPLIGGDALDGSIAAASIVAKVHRDARMRELDGRYPGYGFARHKGYPTNEHLESLRRLGPCEIHRRSYAPVAQLSLL